MSLVTTPAILLRAFPYSESSRVLRFLTRELGPLSVMARGVRQSGARGGTGLATFATGLLTAYVRPDRDLQTFKEFVPIALRESLGGSALRLGGAGLVSELALRHSGEEESSVLFEALEGGLDRIERAPDAEVSATVISEGWRLVVALGYRPVLGRCVSCGKEPAADETVRFALGAGGIRCARCADGSGDPRVGPLALAQLRSLVGGPLPGEPVRRPRAHLRLLGAFIDHHVSGSAPLESLAFLAQVLPADDA